MQSSLPLYVHTIFFLCEGHISRAIRALIEVILVTS